MITRGCHFSGTLVYSPNCYHCIDKHRLLQKQLMAATVARPPFLPREPSWTSNHLTDDLDTMRGRKRDRSLTRASAVKSSLRPDESSTLRGRSRRRASSPVALLSSRNPSPSIKSASAVFYHRLERSRREHCPSRRPASSVRRREQQQDATAPQRRQRTRSRSRRAETAVASFADSPALMFSETHSSLRNEFVLAGEVEDRAPARGSEVVTQS